MTVLEERLSVSVREYPEGRLCLMLFEVKSVIDVKKLMLPTFKIPEDYNRKEWQRAATWAEWWTLKRHLSKYKLEAFFS